MRLVLHLLLLRAGGSDSGRSLLPGLCHTGEHRATSQHVVLPFRYTPRLRGKAVGKTPIPRVAVHDDAEAFPTDCLHSYRATEHPEKSTRWYTRATRRSPDCTHCFSYAYRSSQEEAGCRRPRVVQVPHLSQDSLSCPGEQAEARTPQNGPWYIPPRNTLLASGWGC